jgi:hypothetical protein
MVKEKFNVTPKGTKASPLYLTIEQIRFLAENWPTDAFCDGVRVHAKAKGKFEES